MSSPISHRFIHYNDMHSDQVLMFAAAAEARQSHPIAHAILAAAAELNLNLPAIDQAHYEVGYGLKVRLVSNGIEPFRYGEPTRQRHLSDHPTVRVGSGRFMTLEGIELPAQIEMLTESCQAQGHSLVMVAVDDELVGCIELQPTMRPEAQRIMEGNLNQLLQLFQLAGEYERNLKRNVRFTTGVSLVAVSGILFTGLTFAATEIFYSLSLFGGLAIAMKPLLDHRRQEIVRLKARTY